MNSRQKIEGALGEQFFDVFGGVQEVDLKRVTEQVCGMREDLEEHEVRCVRKEELRCKVEAAHA